MICSELNLELLAYVVRLGTTRTINSSLQSVLKRSVSTSLRENCKTALQRTVKDKKQS